MRGELDWIVMKALEKDRNRRYETANGLAARRAALPGRRAGGGVPAVGRLPAAEVRPQAPDGAGDGRGRSRLLLVLGAAVSTWQAVRATRAERAERAERDRAVAAEKRAKTEQANARAALDFLWKDVLSQASYRNEPDRDLTRPHPARPGRRPARARTPASRRWWRPRSVRWSGASISI